MFELTFFIAGPTDQTLVVSLYYALWAPGIRPPQAIDAMAVIYMLLCLALLFVALRFVSPTQMVTQIKENRALRSPVTDTRKNSVAPKPVWEHQYDELPARVYRSAAELGRAAAADFAAIVGAGLSARPQVAIVATGNSQLSFFAALHERDDIEWPRVHVLHMDEYLGMGPDHPASFRRYLRENLADRVPLAGFRGLAGDTDDPDAEMARYAELIRELEPVVCVLGIGENGHLAFNDPPADFHAEQSLRIVELDDACRRQQWGEGHFPTLDAVPREAITLTIPALLAPAHVLAVVPEARKAAAVQAALTGPVSPSCPASALRTAGNTHRYLDSESAALLPPPVQGVV